MGISLFAGEPLARAIALQESLCQRALGALPHSPKELFKSIRRNLLRASDEGQLSSQPEDIFRLVKLGGPPAGAPPGARGIVGGEKDFHRRPETPTIVRNDGARFHFTICVHEANGALVLDAYDFELIFPHDGPAPPFIRFDLNLPDHDNNEAGLRSHMHLWHEELRAHAPMLAPLEALDLFIHELRL